MTTYVTSYNQLLICCVSQSVDHHVLLPTVYKSRHILDRLCFTFPHWGRLNGADAWVGCGSLEKTYKIFNTALKTTVLIFCAAHEHLCSMLQCFKLDTVKQDLATLQQIHEEADITSEVSTKCEHFKSRLKTHLYSYANDWVNIFFFLHFTFIFFSNSSS